MTRKMPLRQRWEQTSLPNKLMVVGTAIMAIATLGLLLTSVFQYLTAREQSKAAREQAEVAREQARVMQRQLGVMEAQTNTLNESLVETRRAADAAVKSADAALAATEQNKDLIATSKIQASTAQVSTDVAQQSFRITEENLRGLLSFSNIAFPPEFADNQMYIWITWANEGSSRLRIDSGRLRYFTTIRRPTVLDVEQHCATGGGRIFPADIPVQKTVKQRLTAQIGTVKPDNITSLREFFGICGVINYTTLGKSYGFPFCTYYEPENKIYANCNPN